MKKISLLIASILLLSSMSVYADEGTTASGSTSTAKAKIMQEHKKQMQEELKAMKEKMKGEIDQNRDKMKENIEGFKQEEGKAKDAFSGLTDDQKKEVKALHEKHKAEMDALQAEFKQMEKTEENMKAHREKAEALRQAHFDAIQAIVGNNTEAQVFVEKRKEVFQENKALREENMENRIESRGERADIIVKYKEAFNKRLVEKLPKISDEKLEKILARVGENITKVEANSKMSETSKTKIIAQLTALKEMVEEELESRSSDEEILDIEALIAE